MAGIYVHIPFCNKACHYCDFHFSTSFRTKDQIIVSIKKELNLRKNYLNHNKVKTVYFGGGTPSILNKIELNYILSTINEYFSICQDSEITIEVNPNDITMQKIKDYISLGFNRISIGGQSFCDKQLSKLNRTHTSADLINSIKIAQDGGIENINLDLIYALPGLKNEDWIKNLQKAVDLEVPHLSCYCLTIEKGTVFHKMLKNGDLKMDSDQKIKSQFLIMRSFLIKHNFNHYEISNFSKNKYESKHNISYWSGETYLGVGPSAHSYNGTSRHWNISNNTKYINALEKNSSFFEEEILTRKNIINEYILTALRTNKGLDSKRLLEMLTDKERSVTINQINYFIKDSLIEKRQNTFFLTEEGMILCDKITSDLFLV